MVFTRMMIGKRLPFPHWPARTAAAALAAGLIATLSLPGAPAARAAAAPNYVALGDSYASGPLIPNQVDAACLRSDHDYPALTAASLHPASFKDVSCSGATTADIGGSQSTALGPVPPQLDALGPDTTLVTLSIGGNDIGFATVATRCALASLLDPFGNPCQRIYTAGGTDQLAEAVKATAPKVAGVLGAIHQRSPHAQILVVAYLDILPTTGPGCWPVMPIASGDVAYLRGVEESLNQMLATTAAGHGATYVDAYTPSIGHDVCQLLTKWVEGVIPTLPAYPVHPNVFGMQATAGAVLASLPHS